MVEVDVMVVIVLAIAVRVGSVFVDVLPTMTISSVKWACLYMVPA